MKLSALLLLSAFASACVAQSTPAPSQNQTLMVDGQTLSRAAAASAGDQLADKLKEIEKKTQFNCPVVLTSAWLAPRLQLLKAGDDPDGNGIDLEFRNASGKEIRSMDLSATILVKKTIYDLGYLPPLHLHLTVSGIWDLDSAFDELRRLTLPSNLHPALVDSVRLEQVTFADGSVWSPATDQYCGLKSGSMRSIAR